MKEMGIFEEVDLNGLETIVMRTMRSSVFVGTTSYVEQKLIFGWGKLLKNLVFSSCEVQKAAVVNVKRVAAKFYK